MNGADRTVLLLGLAVAPSRRARFVEEWRADVESARSIGLSPGEILAAAAHVAGFLLWTRVRMHLVRQRTRGEPLGAGVLGGLVLAVADVQVDVVLPFVVLAVGLRAWALIRSWIAGGS